VTLTLAHAGHYAGYAFAAGGIVALLAYDLLRRRRRS
jgi:hypothetical protein